MLNDHQADELRGFVFRIETLAIKFGACDEQNELAYQESLQTAMRQCMDYIIELNLNTTRESAKCL